VLTAFRIYPYLPSITSIKAPEIPGKIIAHIATAPEMKRKMELSGVFMGVMPRKKNPPKNPTTSDIITDLLPNQRSLAIVMADAETRPKKNDQMKTG